jgi:16S rRNA G527 N7-methylase RsmG
MERKTLKEILSHVKRLGFKPKTIIDVGVAYGTPGLYGVFDDVKYLLVDPLREYETVMQDI